MTSYLSNLLTQTTSRYNSIRKALLSDESDGDTEDDSHVCRVLRAYYTEKGRPFPPWLPPDPNAPSPVTPAPYVSSVGRTGTPMSAMSANSGRSGGLSDLWDSPQQPQKQAAPQSLRAGGRTLQPRVGIVDSYNQEPAQRRPLPSQQAGSYQTQFSQSASRLPAQPSPPPSAGSGGSAQERLKARLWGSGRTTSPTPSTASDQSAMSSSAFSQSETRNPYDRGGNFQSSRSPVSDRSGYNSDRNPYSSGGGGGNPYSSGSGGGGNPYGSGGGSSYGNNPYESGNSSYSGSRQPGREKVGLPSGPRGLPSGPKLR